MDKEQISVPTQKLYHVSYWTDYGTEGQQYKSVSIEDALFARNVRFTRRTSKPIPLAAALAKVGEWEFFTSPEVRNEVLSEMNRALGRDGETSVSVVHVIHPPTERICSVRAEEYYDG